MNSFTLMLIWGIFTVGIGVSMFFTLSPSFDCNTLPKGYWDNTCQKVNLINIVIPFGPIGLGSGIIICGFKFFRERNPNYNISKESGN